MPKFLCLFLAICMAGYNCYQFQQVTNGQIAGKVNPVTSTLRLKATSKSTETFYCSSCGAEHIKWMGKCSACNEWNTVKAFKIPKLVSQLGVGRKSTQSGSSGLIGGSSGSWLAETHDDSIVSMDSVEVETEQSRLATFSSEVNRVLGGGLVKGSIVLLAGEPGIGKSTLLIQLASHSAALRPEVTAGGVVYISGEENADQIVSRARRLKLGLKKLFVMCETDTDHAIGQICAMADKPALVIVDSVQTMRTADCASGIGSVTQIRECTAKFVQLAKSTGVVVLLVGHVTKSGDVAGPKVLEHMVDTVLYMEGSERADYRLLRGIKNRFE